MIQRIQHIYIFLILLAGLWFSSAILMEFPASPGSGQRLAIKATGAILYQNQSETILSENKTILWTVLLLILNCIVILFMFKKREKQIGLCLLNYFLIGGVMLSLFYMLSSQTNFNTFRFDQLEGNSFLSYLLGIVMMILNYLAIRGIKKDDALVRSADRIR